MNESRRGVRKGRLSGNMGSLFNEKTKGRNNEKAENVFFFRLTINYSPTCFDLLHQDQLNWYHLFRY